jgi:hypothetical protein
MLQIIVIVTSIHFYDRYVVIVFVNMRSMGKVNLPMKHKCEWAIILIIVK